MAFLFGTPLYVLLTLSFSKTPGFILPSRMLLSLSFCTPLRFTSPFPFTVSRSLRLSGLVAFYQAAVVSLTMQITASAGKRLRLEHNGAKERNEQYRPHDTYLPSVATTTADMSKA